MAPLPRGGGYGAVDQDETATGQGVVLQNIHGDWIPTGAQQHRDSSCYMNDYGHKDRVVKQRQTRSIVAVVAVGMGLVGGLYWMSTVRHQHDPSSVARFYEDQLVDHTGSRHDLKHHQRQHYSQRYFEKFDYWEGPGHPLFVIMGGEDPLDDEDGILYPFVMNHLAKVFGGYTMCIEHRFYGTSYPISDPTDADLARLLTPGQAMDDAVRLIRYKQRQLGCSSDPGDVESYCPVVTVGASYPGFLASLLRIVHPDTVDIGYGSSVPFHLYAHTFGRDDYFDKITTIADAISPGCADAVRSALLHVQDQILNHAGVDSVRGDDDDNSKGDGRSVVNQFAAKLGICTDSLPAYIDNTSTFVEELMIIIAGHFAEDNMGYYPPSKDQDYYRGCQIFQQQGGDNGHDDYDKISRYLHLRTDQLIRRETETKNGRRHASDNDDGKFCFDMMTELPPGRHGTISAADWSGVGSGPEGEMWDFASCTLIPENSLSEQSMFPPREWTLGWLTKHCQDRFNYTPVEDALVDKYHFDDLSRTSRLLLTNGLKDGWSVASQLTDIVDPETNETRVVAVNMENGAHHSDLTHTWTEQNQDQDTPDVQEAHVKVTHVLSEWLDELQHTFKEEGEKKENKSD